MGDPGHLLTQPISSHESTSSLTRNISDGMRELEVLKYSFTLGGAVGDIVL